MKKKLTIEPIQSAKVLWDFLRVGRSVSKSELIIGLGSYDLRVADRCVDLLITGMANRILFSGAAGNWTRGLWKMTEADIFKEHALRLGVSSDHIILENHSTNIGDNIRFSKNVLQSYGLLPQKVIFVTKPQTERRVWATVPKEWADIDFHVTSPHTEFRDQPLPHHSMDDLINEMVGDLQRIKVYATKGWQLVQEIPEPVEEAYLQLIALGYTHHMLNNN